MLIVSALVVLSCNNKDNDGNETTSEVQLNFRGYYDQSDLMMYEAEYPYEEGMDVRFQLFHFYVSDVALLRDAADGGDLEIVPIDLVTFRDIQSPEEAERGYTLIVPEVPTGTYRGIRLGVGVPADLNKTQPGDYPTDHPLSENYWSWALGYVFFKVEGNADTNGDGQFSDKLTFHIGGDDFYRNLTFSQPIEVRAGEPLRLDFEVDLHRVLSAGNGQFVDFRKVTQDHTNDLQLAAFMADNLAAAISIKEK